MKREDQATWEEYPITASFDGGRPDQFIGDIYLPTIITPQDMPIQLEINGVVYFPHF